MSTEDKPLVKSSAEEEECPDEVWTEYSFLIPVKLKEDAAFSKESIDNIGWFEFELYLLSPGGGQKDPGLVSGWHATTKTPTATYDYFIRYRVALADGACYDFFINLLQRACDELVLKCIYLNKGGDVEFVKSEIR